MSIVAVITSVVTLAMVMTTSQAAPLDAGEYMKQRAQIIGDNEKTRIGADLVLNADEAKVNAIFMREKHSLIESSRVNGTLYFPSASIFASRPLIERTYLYSLVRRMPKGAALHLHDQSMVSLDWLIYNITYRDHVYMCLKEGDAMYFKVFMNDSMTGKDCEWKLVSAERKAATDVTSFDMSIRSNLSLVFTDPYIRFPDNQAAWVRFESYFSQISELLLYYPIYRDMIWETLLQFRADNVQYFEVRLQYSPPYDLDGKQYTREETVQVFKELNDAFVQQYPDFTGMKIIFLGGRSWTLEMVLDEVKEVITLHKTYPEVVSGYDLANNEEQLNPLSLYREALLYPSQQNYSLPYFIHAGETSWQGTETGYNLVDALILNATRVGHAFALGKHPHLMKLYKERDIILEVQPISNQVLRLVSDLKNHPMATLIADNFSIAISCDDRTTMDTAPLSHDYFVVFTALSSADADLTLLKQLAINSIRFSSLHETQKQTALALWQTKWDEFIADVLTDEHYTTMMSANTTTVPPTTDSATKLVSY